MKKHDNDAFWAQYKHPEWQKKRLQVLEANGWACSLCRSSEKTLHVHHHGYVKGRKIWEYRLDEFACLCEGCHEETHKSKEKLQWFIRFVPARQTEKLASMIYGAYREEIEASQDDDEHEWHECYSAPGVEAGVLARVSMDHLDLMETARLVVKLLELKARGLTVDSLIISEDGKNA